MNYFLRLVKYVATIKDTLIIDRSFFKFFSAQIADDNLPNSINLPLILAFIRERSHIPVSIVAKNLDIFLQEITTNVTAKVALSTSQIKYKLLLRLQSLGIIKRHCFISQS